MNGLFSSVQARLTVLVGGGIGLLLVVASIAIFQLKTHINEYHDLLDTSIHYERDISDLNLSFKTQVQEWKNVLLRGKDPEKYKKYWDQFTGLQKEIQTKGQSLADTLPDDESKKLLEGFLRAHAAAYAKYEQGAAAFKAADFDASVGDKAVTGIDREPSKMLSECTSFISKQASEINTEINTSSATVVFWSTVLVAGFGIAIIALVLITLKNSFVTPLFAVISHIELLSRGNFGTRLKLNQQGELGELNRNLDRMQDSLIAVIESVKQSSSTLNQASRKISDTANAISNDTHSSHQATDQVAAAINEMSSTVQEVANNASGAADAAQVADANARKGMAIMQTPLPPFNN
jgi:methyl-accepting chemotaxis protein